MTELVDFVLVVLFKDVVKLFFGVLLVFSTRSCEVKNLVANAVFLIVVYLIVLCLELPLHLIETVNNISVHFVTNKLEHRSPRVNFNWGNLNDDREQCQPCDNF